jgi:hypothetical protein
MDFGCSREVRKDLVERNWATNSLLLACTEMGRLEDIF